MRIWKNTQTRPVLGVILSTALTLVLLPLPGQAQNAQFTAERVMRIGELDGQGALSQPFALELTRDGKLLVAEPQIPGFLVFDSQGRFERVVGRRGQGPGEYTTIGHLGWIGDTLYALDLGRIHFYGPDLEYMSSLPTAVERRVNSDIALVVPGPLTATGHIIGLAQASPAAESRSELRVPILLLDRKGAEVRTIVHVHAAGRFVTFAGRSPGPPMRRARNPWADDDLWTLTADDSKILVASRRSPTGNAARSSFSVTALALTGDTLFHRTFEYRPREIARQESDQMLRTMAEQLSRGLQAPVAALEGDLRDALRPPRSYPPLSGLVAGRDGTIWLRREDVGASVRWDILDSVGTQIGHVTLPANLRVLKSERQRVWGVWRDELDVPYIEVWHLR